MPKIIPPFEEINKMDKVKAFELDERNCTLQFKALGNLFEDLPKKQNHKRKVKRAWKNNVKMNKNSIDDLMRSTQALNKLTKFENKNKESNAIKEQNYTDEWSDKNALSISNL